MFDASRHCSFLSRGGNSSLCGGRIRLAGAFRGEPGSFGLLLFAQTFGLRSLGNAGGLKRGGLALFFLNRELAHVVSSQKFVEPIAFAVVALFVTLPEPIDNPEKELIDALAAAKVRSLFDLMQASRSLGFIAQELNQANYLALVVIVGNDRDRLGLLNEPQRGLLHVAVFVFKPLNLDFCKVDRLCIVADPWNVHSSTSICGYPVLGDRTNVARIA